MFKKSVFFLGMIVLTIGACTPDRDNFSARVEIPEFNFPKTIDFASDLETYSIYQGPLADLTPSEDYQFLELSSKLFTDYAHKQRLVKVPEGTQIQRQNDGSLEFPDGTILVKTFYYNNDERDLSTGKKIIETRLMIKEEGVWNIATYLWNDAQDKATLTLNGHDTQISWIDSEGATLSTLYHVPKQNECMTCHQSNSSLSHLGPTLRNLNRTVERNGTEINQISHLQTLGILNNFEVGLVSQIPDYTDLNVPLEERARAYLAMNCAHCHNPQAWEAPAERDFDFRYETSLNETGILFAKDKITDAVSEGEMPFIGTTLPDREGIDLIIEFIESL